MALRGNLFIRIFIGFWLVTIAILASWMLTSDYFDSRPLPGAQPGHRPTGPPHRFMLRTIYNLQNLDDQALATALSRTLEEHNVQIYLLDRSGNDLLEREVPTQVTEVAGQLRGGRRRAFRDTPRGRLLAHDIYRREQGPLRAVFVFQPPRHELLAVLGGNLWLRIGLAVLVSGLLCFALSRMMTNRLKALQRASRELANGQLDTRLQVRDKGGDETDELARDFNSMAQQLQERIQAQKRLLADVSHELRSPLARLRIALALAQEDSEKSAQYLQRIEQEAERLEELIGQLLSSQLQNISLDTHIDLVPLLEQLCTDANFEGQQQAKRVVFETAVEQAIVASAGDLLHKSLENVLRNALTHTPPDSRVSVTLTATNGCYRVSIQDQGPGIAPEELDNIFGEFYRVDAARSRDAGGYGLGLAITRRAIRQHGGQVQAVNTGGGLQIIINLPEHS